MLACAEPVHPAFTSLQKCAMKLAWLARLCQKQACDLSHITVTTACDPVIWCQAEVFPFLSVTDKLGKAVLSRWQPIFLLQPPTTLPPTSSVVLCRSVELDHLHKLAMPCRSSQFTVWLECVHSWWCVPLYSTLFLWPCHCCWFFSFCFICHFQYCAMPKFGTHQLKHLHELAVPCQSSQLTVWLECVYSWLCVRHSTFFQGSLALAHPTAPTSCFKNELPGVLTWH